MAKTFKVDDDVRDVLRAATFNGTRVSIGTQKLEQNLYKRVNKVLEGVGGKWNRKEQCHVFTSDPRVPLNIAIEDGVGTNLQQAFQAFYTPDDLARRMVELVAIQPGESVLEPSAGEGALANAARDAGANVTCVEIREESAVKLVHQQFTTVCCDFMESDSLLPQTFDAVLMNPPFTAGQDVTHVLKAFGYLREGGRLISIMSSGVRLHSDSKHKSFRELVKSHGTIEDLPENAFRESGTSVNTVLVQLHRS